MSEQQLQELATKAAAEIEEDILDRKGIGDELGDIDEGVMQEIRDEWVRIIMETFREAISK
jgi:hypothetical protein